MQNTLSKLTAILALFFTTEARADLITVYLVEDLGVNGEYRHCLYDNDAIIYFPKETACPESTEDETG